MTPTEPSPSAQFAEFLSRFPPTIVALAKKCLPKLRRAVPHAFQHVYNYANSLVVSFSPNENGYDGIVSLSIDARQVRLYFLDGMSLPDPHGRLEGKGSKVRSVALASASDIDHGDVAALLE